MSDRADPPYSPWLDGALKGSMRGFMEAYRPSGLGYQIQTWRVTRSGCQNTNGEPVSGLVGAQSVWAAVKVKVPSS